MKERQRFRGLATNQTNSLFFKMFLFGGFCSTRVCVDDDKPHISPTADTASSQDTDTQQSDSHFQVHVIPQRQ